MKKRELISSQIAEVKSNGSIVTKKASTSAMVISDRFAIDAQSLFLDIKEGIEREKGLVNLELYAVYSDGHEDPENAEIEIVDEEGA